MLKIWLDIWTAVVRQLFIRQVQLSESRRQSLVSPSEQDAQSQKSKRSQPPPSFSSGNIDTREVAQAQPVSIRPAAGVGSGAAAGKRVEAPATSSNSDLNRRVRHPSQPTQQHAHHPNTPRITKDDVQRTRSDLKRTTSRRSAKSRSSSNHRLTKPLPPIPEGLLSVPQPIRGNSSRSFRPSAPRRISSSSTVINLRSSRVSIGRLSTMADDTTFRDVMKAAYDYEATAEDELSIKEDQLVYLLGQLDDE